MSVLTDYYNTGDDSVLAVTDTTWWTQNFTASATYSFVSAKLLMYRAGASTGTVTISIRATDINNKPTGDVLASGTFDGDTLTTSTTGEWKEIIFSVPLSVTSGTKYAIQVYRSSATSTVYWRYDATGAYAGGQAARSTDSGSSWTVFADVDLMFETYAFEPEYVDATGNFGITSGFGGVATVIEPTLATGSFSISSSFSGVGSFITLREAVGTIALTSYLLGKLSAPAFFEWVLTRPPVYDNTKVFDDTSMTWVANDGRGGGRFQEQVLAIGQGSDGVSKIFVKVL
jgi:hypothetical protein